MFITIHRIINFDSINKKHTWIETHSLVAIESIERIQPVREDARHTEIKMKSGEWLTVRESYDSIYSILNKEDLIKVHSASN